MNWRQDAKKRWGAALLMSFIITVSGGYAYKFIIESFTDYEYVIHWIETVPLITIFIALLLQREWKRSLASDEEE